MLESEAHKRARRRASEMGVSFAEYVRRVVERDLGREARQADVTRIFDLGASERTNVAKNKHAMVAEAFLAQRKRSRRSARP
jgi:hypothetical protein